MHILIKKNQILIDQQRMTLADVEYLDLDSVAKIVKEFENPSIDSEKFVGTLDHCRKTYRFFESYR